jgi:dienelactone hydrolase
MTQPVDPVHLSNDFPEGDLAAQMVAGIGRFLTRETEASIARRARHWQRDFSSPEAYARSVAPNRQRLRRIIGVVDPREEFTDLELRATASQPALIATGARYQVLAVRWPVLKGVDADGLLLQPEGEPAAAVVALPDCDLSPEQLVGLAPGLPPQAQYARRLAERGCRVLIPTLINRGDTYSGHPEVRMTNQPHREFIYRGALEMGRHVIGYEVQKVLAAVDWLARQAATKERKIGVIGAGEGGLLSLYSAALDERIDAALVSGYFQSRQELWREPIYRSVWGLLEEFGDAELASLVAPRTLIIEASRHPEIAGPPPAREGRSGAAPGRLTTPPLAGVAQEFQRARELTAGLNPPPSLHLIESDPGDGLPAGEAAFALLLTELGAVPGTGAPPAPRAPGPTREGEVRPVQTGVATPEEPGFAEHATPGPRATPLKRAFDQLVEYNQHLMREGEFRRREFWAKAEASSPQSWQESCRAYREYLWDEVIGRFPPPSLPPNPRSRLIYDEPKYRGYEIVLDVWPDVFASGILLVPKDAQPGERRPVVVCQHGLEGRPQDLADPRVDHPAYHQYACRLAERGFITFSPQNPYIGEERFRVLQRKAHPLKKSLFAVIVRQHERVLEWLGDQPFVDPERIAFYGLSYGGKTAMRVPALLEKYCLSICSADYNEWIWKNVSTRHSYSYMFTGEYDMVEFDLGNTFNYAEMSWLICPRPFMVERGHDDDVAPDEWVAYEFAKTQRRYDQLGLGDRAAMEVFNGPHTINGVGTFEFLNRHLNWPLPEEEDAT